MHSVLQCLPIAGFAQHLLHNDLLIPADLYKLFPLSSPSLASCCPQTPQDYYQVRAFALVSSPLNALNHILPWLMISAQIMLTSHRHSLNIQSEKKVLNPIHTPSFSSSFFQSWSLYNQFWKILSLSFFKYFFSLSSSSFLPQVQLPMIRSFDTSPASK